MAKYRYRIEGGRYGGELAVGTVTNEFVEYWAPVIEHDGAYDTFIPHVLSLSEWDDDEDIDSNAPAILEESNEIPGWYELDDIEHINSAYADGGFYINSVPTDESDDWAYDDEEVSTDGYCLKGREGAYVSTDNPEGEYEPEDYTPVMLFHSSEKGSFACWFAETDGEDFDEFKLGYSIVETNLCEMIENVYYDKQELEPNYDYNDTTGKGYDAEVGWLNMKWHDSDDLSKENMEDYWLEYDENVEWERENR